MKGFLDIKSLYIILLPLKDAFLNHELEFDHGLDQTRVFFELLGIAPREPIFATA